MRKSSIGSILVLGLVASLLQASPAAYSNGQTVVKTFVVTDSANLPVENVSVALFGFNEDTNETFLSEDESTNEQGRATITVPANIEYFGWSAQPAGTDNALFTDYSVAQGETETLYAKLKPANLVVQVGNVNVPVETTGASIYFPSTDDGASGVSYRVIIKPRAFGIDLSPALVETGSYSISVEPNATTTKFAAKYGLKAVGNPVSGYSVFTDTTYLTPLQALSSVYTLAFSGENFKGQLRNATGGALTIPAGVRVFAQVLKANADGSVNLQEGQEASSFFQVGSSGTFTSRIYTPTAGKYFVQFTSSGSTSIPTFLSSPFWINGSGAYSASETGAYQASNVFNYSASIPANPNVKIRSTKANGSANSNIYISLNQRPQNGGDEIWWGYASASNGISSFSMPDGAYKIFIDPSEEGLLRAEYRLVIDQGIAYVSTGIGSILNADSAGVFQLALGTPNLQVRLVRPGSQGTLLNDANVDVFRNNWQGDNYVTNGYARSGLAALLVPNGTFTLRVNPFGGSLAAKEYQLVVSGSVITITDGNTPVVPQNGIYTLEASAPNVTGVVEEKTGDTYFPFAPRREKWASVQIEKFDPQDIGYPFKPYADAQVGSGGAFAALVSEPGTYRITVRVNNSPNATNTTFEEFTITDDLTIRTNEQTPRVIASFSGDDSLQLRPPTLEIRVKQESSSDGYLEYASIHLSNELLSLNEHYETGSSGVAGIAISTGGTYKLQVRPPNNVSSAVSAMKEYTLIATPITPTPVEGPRFTLVIKDPANQTVGTELDGVYDLSLGVPNVIGRIVSSSEATFDRAAGNNAWVEAQKLEGNNWQWINLWADVSQDGSFGLNIEEDGVYRLLIEPFGITNSSSTKTVQFEIEQGVIGNAGDIRPIAGQLDFGTIRLSSPTALFKVRESGSTENLTFTSIEIHQKIGNNWEWLDWRNVNSDGTASFTATEDGKYRFTAMPSDTSDNSVKKTYEGSVETVSGAFVLTMDTVAPEIDGSFVLTLGIPNVSGRLVDKGGSAVINQGDTWAWVQVQKFIESEDRWEWIDNSANVRADGKFALDIGETGTYRLRIETGGRSDLALTYSESFEIINASDFSKSFGNITMNSPALAGSVSNKDGNPQAGSQVIAIDVATGQEMWEYSTSTDNAGNWGMVLPAGSYKIYARPASQDSTQGNSLELSGVVVNSDGLATVSGDEDAAGAIELLLTPPTWSGTVISPIDNTLVIRNASVCLFVVVNRPPSCTESNYDGEWALSTPSGVTSFNDDSTLTVRPNQNPEFAEARYEGRLAIEAVLGRFDEPLPFIALSPDVPNATFKIIEAVDVPAVNVWVSVHVVVNGNREWLGGSSTDDQGKVRFSLPTDKDFVVEVQPNPGSEFTAVRRSYLKSVLDNDPFDTEVIQLGTPNLKGVVYKPGGTLPVRDAWVEIYNVSKNEWIGGSGTNALGQFSLGLDVPDSEFTWYRITAHPSGSEIGEPLSRSTFYAKVSAPGSASSVELFTAMPPAGVLIEPDIHNLYSLELKAPTAGGFVFGPDGETTIKDSFVVPVDVANNKRQLWELGQNSRENGSFGLALEDGSYKVFASSPYLSNYSRSAMCSVVIAGGTVDMQASSADCVDSGSKINLKLREPNLTFKLVDPNGGAGVANAHVGVGVGEWYGWAQSSKDGVVSLFIDQDEIAESNPSWASGELSIRVNVQAPHDNSTLASWQCNAGEDKPVCDDNRLTPVEFDQDYTNGIINLGDIEFLAANTFVDVTNTLGDPSSGAWVSVFKQEAGGWNRYINSAGTNSDGVAALYIDLGLYDAEDLFTVEINPPWELRSTHARKTISGLTRAEMQARAWAFALPNLTLTIKEAPAPYEVSRWSNVWIEEVEQVGSDFRTRSWINGYGSDDSGVITMSLDTNAPDRLYRINVNPGSGSVGTRTSCIVSVDEEGTVTRFEDQCPTGGVISQDGQMELKLSAGNFTGSVKLGTSNGSNAAGAIVFAQAKSRDSGSLVAGITEETVVDSEGNYGLQLNESYDWVVKVFYVNPPGATTLYNSISLPQVVSRASSGFAEEIFVLSIQGQD